MTGPALDENALDAAASRARAANDRTLAIVLVAGILGIVASGLAGYPRLMLPFVASTAFGAWGIIDHFARRNILRYSRNTRTILRRIKQCIAAIGVIAVMAFAFVFFGDILGVIIS